MRQATRLRLIGAGGALLLLLPACGSDEAEAQTSPLNAIWGEPDSEAESRAKQLQQEEMVAQCMKDEGWEYIPIDWAAQWNNGPEWEDPSEPGYGEKYGYGIVRNFQVYELPYLNEDGVWSDDGSGGQTFEDPNQEYVMSLSPEENEQYYATMYGDQSKQQPEIDPETGEEIWIQPPLEEQGCYGKAQLEVYGEQPWSDQDFNDRYNELFEDLENDPAIYDAEIVWSDCAYDANNDYDFASPDDVYTYVQNLLNEIRGMDPIDPMPTEATDAPVATMVVSPDGGSEDARLPSDAEIAEVLAEEVELWKVDQECQDESGLRDIRRQREQEIVDTIREEFPQFMPDGEA